MLLLRISSLSCSMKMHYCIALRDITGSQVEVGCDCYPWSMVTDNSSIRPVSNCLRWAPRLALRGRKSTVIGGTLSSAEGIYDDGIKTWQAKRGV